MLFQCSLSLFEFQFFNAFWDTLQFSSPVSLRLLLRLQFPAVTSGDEVLGVSQSVFVWHFYKVSVVSEWPTTPRCLEENKGLGDSELSLFGFQHFGIKFTFPHFVSVQFFIFRSFHFIPFCIFVLFIFGFGRFCLPGTSWNCCLSGPSSMLLLKQN